MRRKAWGDIDEPIIIKNIIKCRDQKETIKGIQDKIISVKDISLNEYPTNFQKIKKSPSYAKADVYVNNLGYSIKSYTAAPPTIINSSTREKFLFVCDLLNISIKPLDVIIDEYWRLVLEDGHSLTFHNEEKNSIFSNKMSYLKKIILYFLFDGTGKGYSEQRAEGIIFVKDPNDISTYSVMGKEKSFNVLWPGMYWNVRKRFIDSRYRNLKDDILKDKIKPWVRKFQGFYYGELQLRAPILSKLELD